MCVKGRFIRYFKRMTHIELKIDVTMVEKIKGRPQDDPHN